MQEVLKMTYILVETNNASGIFSPLKTTNRIKVISPHCSALFATLEFKTLLLIYLLNTFNSSVSLSS